MSYTCKTSLIITDYKRNFYLHLQCMLLIFSQKLKGIQLHRRHRIRVPTNQLLFNFLEWSHDQYLVRHITIKKKRKYREMKESKSCVLTGDRCCSCCCPCTPHPWSSCTWSGTPPSVAHFPRWSSCQRRKIAFDVQKKRKSTWVIKIQITFRIRIIMCPIRQIVREAQHHLRACLTR